MNNDTTHTHRIRLHEIDGEHRLLVVFLHADVAVYLTPDEVHSLAHDFMDWSMWLDDHRGAA